MKGALVILQHRFIQRALYYSTYIIPVLFQNGVEIVDINRAENCAERYEQYNCSEGDYGHNPAVNG